MADNSQLQAQILKTEDLILQEDDYNETPPRDVLSFNEMRSCADIKRLHEDGQLDIAPDFQRGDVWQMPDKTRFIDSLSKQLPIPSMCYSIDSKTQKRIVIDGLQRTSTIISFLNASDEWKLSRIVDVDDRLSGKTNLEIKNENPQLWGVIQNVMIPVTVIHCDYNNPQHMEYLYKIFHRLNTGSIKLNNQEIRNCIYNGEFNSLLKDLGETEEMVNVYGESKRFSNSEYALRLMAFHENLGGYDGHMSKFLNSYMGANRNEDKSRLADLIKESLSIIYKYLFMKRDLKSLSRTVNEGLTIGVMSNYNYVADSEPDYLAEKLDELLQLPEYSAVSLSEGLTSKKKVVDRLTAAIDLFEN